MKIHSLKLHNFGSFADCELDLNRDGLIAVTGDNGAGKSTLFRAVEWALYGSKRGPSSLPVRRDNAPEGEPCSVELTFEVGGHTYRPPRPNYGTSKASRSSPPAPRRSQRR